MLQHTETVTDIKMNSLF